MKFIFDIVLILLKLEKVFDVFFWMSRKVMYPLTRKIAEQLIFDHVLSNTDQKTSFFGYELCIPITKEKVKEIKKILII